VRLLRQDSCGGVAAARNLAIASSSGLLIAPLDADDLWYPQKLAKQVELMVQSPPQVGLVYAWSAHLDAQGELTAGGNLATDAGDVLLGMILRNFIGHASAPLIRRSALENVGLYEPKFARLGMQGCEDRDLYLRLAERYDYAVVPEVLIGYRRHDGAMSRNASAMAGGNELIMQDLAARRRDVPPLMFRWARSQFFDYLSNQTSQSGHYLQSLKWMNKAVWHDPMLLMEGRVWRRLVAAPMKLALRPILRWWHGDDRRFWRSVAKVIWPPRPVSLETLGRAQQKAPSDRARRMEGRLGRMRRQMQELNKGSRPEMSRPQFRTS